MIQISSLPAETLVITYAGPTNITFQTMEKFKIDFPNIKWNQKSNIVELFPLLSDPSYHTDFVVIDVESFYSNLNSNVFQLIDTLKTLIDCTVQRTGTGKPVKRSTKIVGLASENTPVNLIKDIIGCDGIDYIIPRTGENINYDMACVGLREIISYGPNRVDKFILELIKPQAKKSQSTTEIELTPRQGQILNLITSRGASNKVIARTLNISESTVKLHMGAIFKKYGVRNRTQLAIFGKS